MLYSDVVARGGHARSPLRTTVAPWRIADPIRFGPDAPSPTRLVQVARQRAARAALSLLGEREALVRSAWHQITPNLVAAARRVPADLYIAHYPAALPAAAIAARQCNARYAYDAEDYHLGDAAEGAGSERQRRLLRAVEGRYLPGCAYITAASPGIADAYVETYGCARPTVVLNVFPRSYAPPHSTSTGAARPGPSVYWFSQTIGTNRGLEAAVRAIGRARSRPHLYLRGSPSPGFASRLHQIAEETGAADRLHLLPPAAPSEMARLAVDYDVALSGEPGFCPNNRIALGNKIFSYLLGGVPVLMSDTPAHRAFARHADGAVRLYPVDDERALALTLDEFLLDAPALARARSVAFALGQERYNWDLEARTFLGAVKGAIGDAETPAVSARPRVSVQ